MAKPETNPWRRGPVNSNSRIPVAARSSAPLNPTGKAIGFFVKPTAQNKKFPGNQSPGIDPPMVAFTGKVR